MCLWVYTVYTIAVWPLFQESRHGHRILFTVATCDIPSNLFIVCLRSNLSMAIFMSAHWAIQFDVNHNNEKRTHTDTGKYISWTRLYSQTWPQWWQNRENESDASGSVRFVFFMQRKINATHIAFGIHLLRLVCHWNGQSMNRNSNIEQMTK